MLKIWLKRYQENYTGLPKACWQSVFLVFAEAILGGLTLFVSLYLVNRLHISIEKVGAMLSAYGLGTIAGGILGGKLADKYAPHHLVAISLVIESCSFILLMLNHSIPLLILILLQMGIATYAFKSTNNMQMLTSCEHESILKLRVINMSRIASNAGLAIAGTLIGLFANSNFDILFFIAAIGLLILAAYVFFYTKPLIRMDESMQSIPSISKTNIQRYGLSLVLACLFLTGLIIAQLSSTYPIFIEHSYPFLGTKAVVILFIVDTLLISILQAPLVEYCKQYNHYFIIGIGSLLMGSGMFILPFAFSFAIAVLSCVLLASGEMIFFSMTQYVCYEQGSMKKKGESIGLYQAVYAASLVLGPYLGGYICFRYGNFQLWYASGLAGLICFIACVCYIMND